jgi:hypothetical protein
MKKLVFTILLLSFSLIIKAQSNAQDSVKQVINNMFKAMLQADSAGIINCFTEEALMQTFTKNKEGKIIIKSNTVLDFALQISKLPKDSADEQITFESIKIDGPMASVWTPYKLYFNKRFLHCGVNHFVLARLNGIWKIQYIIDTRRKQGCGE